MLDRTVAILQTALDRAAALFLEDVLYYVRRGLPVEAAIDNAAGNMRRQEPLRRGLQAGYLQAWRDTGNEIVALLKRKHPGFGLSQLADDPSRAATPQYRTPRPLDLPDDWRAYSPGQRRATWEWLAEHEATLQQFTPQLYVDKYLSSRLPPLAGIVDRRLLEGARDVAAGIAERGFGVRQSIQALRREFPEFTRHRLENIARTEGAVLYEAGHLSRYRLDPAVTGARFDAVNDSRTTETCRWHDGRSYKLDDPELPEPPMHYMCRSTLAPILFYEEPDWQTGPPPDDARPLAGFGKFDEGLLPENVTL